MLTVTHLFIRSLRGVMYCRIVWRTCINRGGVAPTCSSLGAGGRAGSEALPGAVPRLRV